jgi:hypothetical protein
MGELLAIEREGLLVVARVVNAALAAPLGGQGPGGDPAADGLDRHRHAVGGLGEGSGRWEWRGAQTSDAPSGWRGLGDCRKRRASATVM